MVDITAQRVALHHLAYQYAQALDRNLPEQLDRIFTEDAVVEAPHFRHAGLERIRAIPVVLRTRWFRTFHAVFNQVAEIDAEFATAETYCKAGHLFRAPPGQTLCYEMSIRYQDKFALVGGGWRFTYRRLCIDWANTYAVRTEGDDLEYEKFIARQ